MRKKIKEMVARLEAVGNANSKRTAEELAAHVIGCKPLEVYFKTLSADQSEELDALVQRAEQGEPVQYIVGHVDFRGLEIHCDPRALIPRPETELLVEEVLRVVENGSSVKIADVCTGTGCIALALLNELPLAEVVAVDLSEEALDLARENAERLNLTGRFIPVQGNLLAGFENNSLDVVVSNPPYILSDVCQTLDPSVRDHEPMLALDGGEDGLDLIRPLVAQAAAVLKSGGGLFLEIGYDQGESAAQCLREAGFSSVRAIQDYAGLDRIVSGLSG
jgi:release factor glutamine methyltransferase